MFFQRLALFRMDLKICNSIGTYRQRKVIKNDVDNHFEWGVYQQKQYEVLFSSKSEKLEKQIHSFIMTLNQKQIDKDVFKKIENYLQLQQYEKFSLGSPYSKICLLVAMSIRGISPLIMNPLNKQLVQHISRHDYNIIIQDEITLQIFFKEFQRYLRLQPHKAKSQSLKNFLLVVIKNNFNKLSLKNYPLLVNIISYNISFQAVDYYKYLSIIDLLQERLTQVFSVMMTLGREKIEHQVILQSNFLINLSSLYKLYKFKSKRQLQVYYEFICQHILTVQHMNSSDLLLLINNIYRNFPYNIFNKNNQQYKSLLLQKILNFFSSQKQLKTQFINGSNAHFFLFSVITHHLSLQLQQTPTKIHNGIQYISGDQEIKPAKLPTLFWQIYKQKPHLPDGYSILRNAISKCYPEQYIDTKDKVIVKKPPLIQSEMKIRISECLEQMGINYVSQFETLGRYIDFKLDQNILLQIDGLLHFSIRDFQHLDNTYFRNMHILAGGYKLITISIYEYNMYRNKEQLKKLIEVKYDLVKNKNAIFVL